MIEKRFVGSSGGVYDRYKQDRFVWSEWEEIIRIMNNLNEKARERSKALSKLEKENEQLKQQVEDLEFELRTIKAYDRTVKEEHSDTVYDFQKKLEKW